MESSCEVHDDDECRWVAGCIYPATGRGGKGGGAHNAVDGARSVFEHLGLYAGFLNGLALMLEIADCVHCVSESLRL